MWTTRTSGQSCCYEPLRDQVVIATKFGFSLDDYRVSEMLASTMHT